MKSEDLRDRKTFTLLYEAHHAAVFRFVLGMTGDRTIAAEITQDVFVWLIDHTHRYDPARGEPGPFLIGVARRLLLERNRGASRWVALDETIHGRTDESVHDEPGDDVEELRRAIRALPERYREVVVLCDLESRSYEETAAALECAVGTVRSRLHRARQLLARKLERFRKNQIAHEGCSV